MVRIASSDIDLRSVADRVAKGERVVLEVDDGRVVVAVSLPDAEMLEWFDHEEDRIDVEETQKALKEMQETGEKPIPWARVKGDLGLE